MKKNYYIFLFIILLVPNYFVNADEINEEFVLVSQTDKYYKTIVYNNSTSIYSNSVYNLPNSITVEVPEEEYNNSDTSTSIYGDAGIETTYKKLTSQIYQNSDKYRYKAILSWKNMPSTRSYDIIAIGHHASVKKYSGPYFSLYFCKTDGTCTTTTSYYPQTFNAGTGASFKLPSGSLTTLVTTFYFDVVKTNDVTVYGQIAAADYAHATSSVTSSKAMDYTVGLTGISLGSSISSKYDAMSTAEASWSGTW